MSLYRNFSGLPGQNETVVIAGALMLLERSELRSFLAGRDSFNTTRGIDFHMARCTVLKHATPSGLAQIAARGDYEEIIIANFLEDGMLMRDVLLCARKLIRPYIAEVGSIALGCARDNHPEVIKGLCELMAAVSHDVLQPLVKELDKKQVKPFSTKLIEALLPHITHRHGAGRLQVLGALEELLLCGAGQSVVF